MVSKYLRKLRTYERCLSHADTGKEWSQSCTVSEMFEICTLPACLVGNSIFDDVYVDVVCVLGKPSCCSVLLPAL